MKHGSRFWLKLFAFFVVPVASSSFAAAVLVGTTLSTICSEELALLRKPQILSASYKSANHTVTGSKQSATRKPLKRIAGEPQPRTRSQTLKDVVAKGIGSGIKPSTPSAWQLSNQVALNTWLYYHRSANSGCQEDNYASFGANSSNEISCDWRLQLRI